jgi:hypothetical protein
MTQLSAVIMHTGVIWSYFCSMTLARAVNLSVLPLPTRFSRAMTAFYFTSRPCSSLSLFYKLSKIALDSQYFKPKILNPKLNS